MSGWMEGIHLNDDGRRQAEGAADVLADKKLKAVYSSPIDRCYETAQAIAARHRKLLVTTDHDIGEVGYGRWTNRPLRGLMQTKLWKTVQRRPSAVTFPDGESFRSVQSRAVNAVERIGEKQKRDSVCLVSHGDVIKLVLAHYVGMHIDHFQRIVIAPASVSTLAVGDGGVQLWSLNAMPMTIPGKSA